MSDPGAAPPPASPPLTIAITGATGFIGQHVLREATQTHRVRALTRRPQTARRGVEWVRGDLADANALKALVTDADAVLHLAGAVNALDRAGFAAANVAGTFAVIEAMRAGGARRLVHVSSLAAREPQLSHYGWSKARAEAIVAASLTDWTIVRPPAVYGSGDRELLEVFRMARRRVMLLPPPGRVSMIAAEDLARLLVALAEQPVGGGAIYEPDDGKEGGRSHAQLARAVGNAIGRRVLPVSLSPGLMRTASRIDRALRRDAAKLTADRVGYLCHPDWVARPEAAPPAELWQPAIRLPVGLLETANWYRAARWL